MHAVRTQLESGTAFGAPTELEINLAAAINQRMPSVEKVRFTVSGTEACMFALRLARAHTGRDKVAKCEGGYHGTSDFASISVHPHLADPNDKKLVPMPDTAGLPHDIMKDLIILPFNDSESIDVIVRRNAKELACIIVEPIMRGIPPNPGFLQYLRELADDLGIVLIFDEVITGFRISPGGAQEKYDVRPDLTTMGKVIGGGFPIGAIGGSDEIMSLFAHQKLHFPTPTGPKVPHAGTFNAHPITLAAGAATLHELTTERYEKLDITGSEIRGGFASAMRTKGINGQITGVGSLFDVAFTKENVTNYRTSFTADPVLRRCLDLDLLNRGVYLPPSHFGCTSIATTQDHIHETIRIMSQSLESLLPLIKQRNPQLLDS
jgi:glutamate-1-semialdehyde 2,1-aminomutase